MQRRNFANFAIKYVLLSSGFSAVGKEMNCLECRMGNFDRDVLLGINIFRLPWHRTIFKFCCR